MLEKNERGEVVAITLDGDDLRYILGHGSKGVVFLGMLYGPGLLGDIPYTQHLFSSREQAEDFQRKVQHYYGRHRN